MRSRTALLSLFFILGALVLPLAAHANTIPYFGPIIEASWAENSDVCPLGWGAVILAINNIILIAISIAIVFVAPLMLAWAGFLLVANPFNPTAKQQAKSMLTNTIVGIVIALAGWMIVAAVMAVFYDPSDPRLAGENWANLITGEGLKCIEVASVLNPADLNDPPITGGGTPVEVIQEGEEPLPVGPGQYTHQEAVAALAGHSIGLSSTGGCFDQTRPNCTSLQGIPRDAIARIIEIQSKCNCPITISGGTEVGHKSHGIGLPIVDFNYSAKLIDGIRNSGYVINASFGRGATCEPKGRPGVKIACGVDPLGHIHMEL